MSDKMSDKIVVPHFASESEEADWWYAHREEHGEIMAKAMEEGRTLSLKEVLAQHGMMLPGVAVEFAPEDIARARSQAQARGVNYEDYVRGLLHEALLKNDAA